MTLARRAVSEGVGTALLLAAVVGSGIAAPRIDDDWGLPDPKGQSPERLREIRDMVRDRARALAASLDSRIP